MNLFILISISIACVLFLIFPFYRKTEYRKDNHQAYAEIRKKKVLLELTSELENGTISKDQFNELKEELFKIESIKISSNNEEIDPIEEIIKTKKNQDV
tara:strand:- start:301 stop:597 length:297 start_codon:yes stop_codon:yes gene_type:complete